MDRLEGNPVGVEKENQAIYEILLKILNKWRTEAQTQVKEELAQTLIISPEASQRGPSAAQIQEPEDLLQKTVIVTPRETTGKEEELPVREPEELSETVVLVPQQPHRKTQGPSTEPTGAKIRPTSPVKEDLFSQETVILKPPKSKEKADR